MSKFRSWFAATALALAASVQAATPVVEVFKSPSCGCCSQWVDHLRANGFTVNTRDVPDPSAYRQRYGVPDNLGSCHTAVVAGYAIEGHVPAREIHRLLAERPKARGLAVPGMPMGSPGMEGAYADTYQVVLVQGDGAHRVYAQYQGATPKPAAAAPAELVDGEVRMIDKATRKIGIKHGPIPSLDMAPMSMIFQVRDAAMLDRVKKGDKIKFAVEKVDGIYTVTHIEKTK